MKFSPAVFFVGWEMRGRVKYQLQKLSIPFLGGNILYRRLQDFLTPSIALVSSLAGRRVFKPEAFNFGDMFQLQNLRFPKAEKAGVHITCFFISSAR